MRISSKMWTDLVMGYAVFVQGLMVLFAGSNKLSFMDSFFLAKGSAVFLGFLICWLFFLVFVRRILITPYHHLFCLWVILVHFYSAMRLWHVPVASINRFFGGIVSKGHLGMVTYYSAGVFLLLSAWIIHSMGKQGERIC